MIQKFLVMNVTSSKEWNIVEGCKLCTQASKTGANMAGLLYQFRNTMSEDKMDELTLQNAAKVHNTLCKKKKLNMVLLETRLNQQILKIYTRFT